MKITNKQLRQIIKEELQNVLDEADEFSPSQGPSVEELTAKALTSDNKATVEATIKKLKDLKLTPLVQEKPDGYYFEIKEDFYNEIMKNIGKGSYDSDYDRAIHFGENVTISEPYKKQGDSVLQPGYHAIMKFKV